MTSRPKLVSAIVNLGLSLTVFAVLFGLLEIFIRVTQPVAAAYKYAQCCDYALKPDQDFRFAKAEFDTQVRINALGMRGAVPDLDKLT